LRTLTRCRTSKTSIRVTSKNLVALLQNWVDVGMPIENTKPVASTRKLTLELLLLCCGQLDSVVSHNRRLLKLHL